MLTELQRQLTALTGKVQSGSLTPAEFVYQIAELFKNRPMARALMGFLDRQVPEIMTPLLHERDAIMWRALRDAADKHQAKSIVGVVGIAHLDGIEKNALKTAAKQLRK